MRIPGVTIYTLNNDDNRQKDVTKQELCSKLPPIPSFTIPYIFPLI